MISPDDEGLDHGLELVSPFLQGEFYCQYLPMSRVIVWVLQGTKGKRKQPMGEAYLLLGDHVPHPGVEASYFYDELETQIQLSQNGS